MEKSTFNKILITAAATLLAAIYQCDGKHISRRDYEPTSAYFERLNSDSLTDLVVTSENGEKFFFKNDGYNYFRRIPPDSIDNRIYK